MNTRPYSLVIHRDEFYDPSKKDFVKKQIPSTPIRRAKQKGTSGTNALYGSYYPGAGSVFHVTRIRVDSTPNLYFAVKAREGTIDIIPGAWDKTGSIEAPIYSTRGSTQLIGLGSMGQGTYIGVIEGVVLQG